MHRWKRPFWQRIRKPLLIAIIGIIGLAIFKLLWEALVVAPTEWRFGTPLEIVEKDKPAPTEIHYEVVDRLWLRPGDHQTSAPELAHVFQKERIVPDEFGTGPSVSVTLGADYWLMQGYKSLISPCDSSHAFWITLPRGAQIRTHVGVLPAVDRTKLGALDFSIEIETKSKVKTLWSKTVEPLPQKEMNKESWLYLNIWRFLAVKPIPQHSKWESVRLDLSAYANQPVILRLNTKSKEGAKAIGFWGAPQILGKKLGPPKHFVVYIADAFCSYYAGPYGQKPDLTKTLDEFAAKGALVENYSTVANWSRPGVMTLMTSKNAAQLGFSNLPWKPIPPASRMLFRANVSNPLPKIFADNGYVTEAAMSNIFCMPTSLVGVDLGISSWFQTMRHHLLTFDVGQQAARILAENADTNLFLYIHQQAPNPSDVTPFINRIKAWHIWHWQNGLSYLRYLAAVAYADDHLKYFLGVLKKLGLSSRATVFFTADHGQLNWKHHQMKTISSGEDLKRAIYFHGQTLYEEELSVPMILSGPAIEPGTKIHGLRSALDVMPTILDSAALPHSEGMGGKSFWSDATGKGLTEGHDLVVAEGKFSGAIKTADGIKYIRRYRPRIEVPGKHSEWEPAFRPEELYDIRKDPQEKTNLILARPDLLSEMRSLFDANMLTYDEVWLLQIPEGYYEGTFQCDAKPMPWGPPEKSLISLQENDKVDFQAYGPLEIIFIVPPTSKTAKILLRSEGKPVPSLKLLMGPASIYSAINGEYAVSNRYLLNLCRTDSMVPIPKSMQPAVRLIRLSLPDWIENTKTGGALTSSLKSALRMWGYVK